MSEPKDTVTFYCKECRQQFQSRPDVIKDVPEDDHHPWHYYANCPDCDALTDQAWWERNLLKAWSKATGPRTPEGKAAAAANLEGHPSPDEVYRTRFNAIKHGIHAKTASYFPARPGKYPECDGCELRYTICRQEIACQKKTALFMKFQAAFDSRDPSQLMGIHAGNQAGLQALLNQCFLAIAANGGPQVTEPQWYYDKEGSFHLAGYIDKDTGQWVQVYEIKAHPLLKFIIDLINKNNITMADLEMTPKAKEEQDALRGFVDAQGEGGGESIRQVTAQMNQSLIDIQAMIKRSQEQVSRDPVLIEHQQEEEDV